ncbi:MAG: peptidylprolyl isomerase [Lachnospiraceae bacterium]|nr:peptidylprolyl isomerase [Lachnospiraceae bacterium]
MIYIFPKKCYSVSGRTQDPAFPERQGGNQVSGIVERARKGQKSALIELYGAYKGELFSFCSQALRNEEKAKEAFSLTWDSVWSKLPDKSFTEESEFQDFLLEEGFRACRRFLPRNQQKNPLKTASGGNEESLKQAAAGVTIDEKLDEECLRKTEAASKKQKPPKALLIGAAALLLCLLGAGLWLILSNSAKKSEVPALDANTKYYADIEIKDYGKITVLLDQSAAPITAANFVSLAKSGFYDGLTFHRIMDGFMMQGGDPLGTGHGGSGRNIVGEFSLNGHENPISHKRGVISMARSSDGYDTASSQFFIVQSDSTSLDGGYAAFGKVTEGMDVVDQICADAKPTDNNGTIKAEEQPVILSVTIREEQ